MTTLSNICYIMNAYCRFFADTDTFVNDPYDIYITLLSYNNYSNYMGHFEENITTINWLVMKLFLRKN